MVEKAQEVENEIGETPTQKVESKPEEKAPEVNPERIERMKRAFRPTWLHDQINGGSNGNGKGKKE